MLIQAVLLRTYGVGATAPIGGGDERRRSEKNNGTSGAIRPNRS
ncbi:hypothetical protein FM101_07820 [Arthrobacter rhombi]|uniref:Uncharacterized protein n=1 Tax=Arthrobacter rhombi TaxID=71253 RepID=A0A1R4G552_9MICC|nr:hypothetical protein FM101_07820 [Arthrobacter rhombi]